MSSERERDLGTKNAMLRFPGRRRGAALAACRRCHVETRDEEMRHDPLR